MKAYSPDLRREFRQAIDSGLPQADVAALFDVSVATINRYLEQHRETGHLDPKPLLSKPFGIRPERHSALIALWRSISDATSASGSGVGRLLRLRPAPCTSIVPRDAMRQSPEEVTR